MNRIARPLACAAMAAIATHSQAQALWDVNVSSMTMDSTGVKITANFKNSSGAQQCPNTAIYTQLWMDNWPAASEYHGACYVNAVSDDGPFASGTGLCMFKSPRNAQSTGIPFVRLWKVTQDCQSYAHEVGQTSPSAYQQNWIYGTPATAQRFYGYNNGSLQTIATSKYIAKIDKNGGATYEFYNRRARQDGAPSTEFLANAIHPDVGAALQIAIHDRRGTPIQSPCADASNPYVNPTQAGSFCNTGSVFGSSPVKTTTGGSFPGLVGSVLDTPWFNVLNWNYSNLSSSPQNDRIRGPLTYPPLVSPASPQTDPGSTFPLVDNFQMKQTVTAHNNFLKYDVTVKPIGKENVTLTAEQNPNPAENPVPTNLRPGVTFEAPTFYFATGFRKHTVRRNGVIVTTTVPSRRTATPLTNAQLGMGQAPLDVQLGINDGWNHEDIPWVTFENTDNRTNDVYTIAAFFKPKFRCDVVMIWNQRNFGWTVSETNMYRMIKFAKAPIMNMRYEQEYQFQYVVFPYAWWETPDGETQTVEQLIQNLRTAYETGPGTPNCAPI